MKKTPLYDWHVAHGAKIVEFAGWEMPLYYTSILDEHKTVRTAVGVFDVSHMGRVRIDGRHGLHLLQFTFTNDVETLEVGQARYGLFCNASGGVIDDAIVYRLEDHFLLIPNASNKEAVLRHLNHMATDHSWDARIDDMSAAFGMFALQGPQAQTILQALCEEPLQSIKRFRAQRMNVDKVQCIVARTGYTGEDGFEVICPAERTASLWDALERAGQAKGLQPAGLGSRDSLRIEACLPLYGHELTDETNPLFAGLRQFVKLNKPNFIGKNAMLHWTLDDSNRLLAAFVMNERAVPRQGCPVLFKGQEIGVVTSGLFSPTMNQGIGMAYIECAYVRPGTQIQVRIHNKLFNATVAERPLYKRPAEAAVDNR